MGRLSFGGKVSNGRTFTFTCHTVLLMSSPVLRPVTALTGPLRFAPEELVASFTRRALKRGEHWLYAGDVSRRIAFVESGLLRYVQAKTDIDMRDVRPLSQPWMYIILMGLTALLLLVDIWVIAIANSFVPDTFV